MSRVIRRAEQEKHSIYNVTLSSLRRPHNDAERQQLERVLDEFQDYLATYEGYEQVFGRYSENDRVTIHAGLPEVGTDPRGGRVHIHFVAETIHEGLHRPLEVQEHMREAFIEFAADNGIDLSGAYAHVQLDSRSYLYNYNNKGKSLPTRNRTQLIKRLERDLAEAKKNDAKRSTDIKDYEKLLKKAKP